jgi:hypothetical protein
MDPTGPEAFAEPLMELGRTEAEIFRARLAGRDASARAPRDAAEGRAALLAIVAAAVGRLEGLSAVRAAAGSPGPQAPPAFDTTRSGERLRRHQATCSRTMLRTISTLERLQKAGGHPDGEPDALDPPALAAPVDPTDTSEEPEAPVPPCLPDVAEVEVGDDHIESPAVPVPSAGPTPPSDHSPACTPGDHAIAPAPAASSEAAGDVAQGTGNEARDPARPVSGRAVPTLPALLVLAFLALVTSVWLSAVSAASAAGAGRIVASIGPAAPSDRTVAAPAIPRDHGQPSQPDESHGTKPNRPPDGRHTMNCGPQAPRAAGRALCEHDPVAPEAIAR